jgi:abortive infection bacteriophage resistance protein
MKYSKLPLSFSDQAKLLISRGLIADPDDLLRRLQMVNYYRLSGYLFPYRNEDDTFQAGTTLEKIWNQYTFDRKLRLLVLDAIERLEIAVRTRLAYLHSHRYGPFGFMEQPKLPNLLPDKFQKWIGDIKREFSRSNDSGMYHFRTKYGDSHQLPPVWISVELLTFGQMLPFYRGAEAALQKDVAAIFKIPDKVFDSWLLTLNEVRNICAHHSRLWNRDLGNRPRMPFDRKYPDWHNPIKIPQEKMFAVLIILRYLQKIAAPTSGWHTRIDQLFLDYPDVPRQWMGFPRNWQESVLWQQF